MNLTQIFQRKWLVLLACILLVLPSLSQFKHRNSGKSQSIGTVSNGKIINAYKVPYKGDGYRYFSLFNYYLMGRCYLHSDVHNIVLDSYSKMKEHYPNYTFRLMECSKRKGGRPWPHRTHQNGTSVDFMTPLVKKGKAARFWDNTGMWRYLMKFNSKGQSRISKKLKIDFDKTALHILELEKAARKKGYRIKKVILETNLKDEIFASKYGKELRASGIYFVRSLPKFIDELHDDHYHVDFVKL